MDFIEEDFLLLESQGREIRNLDISRIKEEDANVLLFTFLKKKIRRFSLSKKIFFMVPI